MTNMRYPFQSSRTVVSNALKGVFALGVVCVQLAYGGTAPSMTFYVPFPEADALTALTAVETGGSGDTPINPMFTSVSIAAMADGTIIYYDHWEDGYETDHDYASPLQATTQIWGDGNTANGFPPGVPSDLINAGTVVLLTNTVTTTSPLTIDYDARDKIAATRTISMTRTYWASASGTLFAGCVETFDTGMWGTEYRAPIGVNIADDVDGQMFEYTALSIMAARDNTIVRIDADNNGVFERTNTLNEGQTTFVSGVNVGGRVLADNPLQVILFSGDIGSNYESRDSSLLPVNRWGNNYYSPVSTPSTYGTRVWLYNPGASAITVTNRFRVGTGALSGGSVNVGAGAVVAVTLTENAAYRFFTANGSPFYAYSTTDSTDTTNFANNQAYDWSYTMIPKELLSPQVLIGLGIGRDPTSGTNPTENGNPIWVTAVGNGESNVTVYVDYDGDNVGANTDPNGFKYDASYSLKELQQQKIYDSDGDQTAMMIYVLSTNISLAVAWGQDPLEATPGAPGLDVGTSIPPNDVIDTSKDLTVIGDSSGDGQLGPGDRARYTIRVGNAARAPIPADIIVTEYLPLDTTYVAGSTYYRTSTNGSWIAVTDNGSGTPFPLDGSGYRIQSQLPVKGTFEVRFDVDVDSYSDLTAGAVSIINTGTVHAVVYNRTLTFRNETELHGSLGDRVWNDANNNTLQDPGEDGINGVVVYLDVNTNGVRDVSEPFDTTDANGNYLLTGTFLEAGTHQVRVDTATLPAGFVRTWDLDGTNTANVATVTLAGGQDRVDVDFGYRVPARLGDFVWVDSNGNGQQDSGEPGLSNVVVRLYNSGGTLIATTNSSTSGYYVFTNLAAGTYTVSFTPPANYLSTTSNIGNDATDSDPLPGTNRTANVTLTTWQNETTIDAGFIPAASLAGFVRVDLNGNGVAEVGDTNGIAGVTVQLLDASSNVVATTTTAANGSYSFTGLRPGSYTVREIDLGGWYSTLDITAPNDNLIPVTLAIGQASAGNNFHDMQRASLSGSVRVDVDGDGVIDGEDTVGIAGVTIQLLDATSNTVATTMTDATGSYSFSNLELGNYIVVQNLPAGYTNTVDVVTPNDLRIPRTLTSGQNSTGNDFYDTRTGSVTAQNKVLYLSDPSQALDRISPVAAGDGSTTNTTTIGGIPAATVAIDATSSQQGSTVSSLSFTHVTGSGADRLMLVAIAVGGIVRNPATSAPTVTNVTYGGTALTLVRSQAAPASGVVEVRSYIYSLLNPPTGSANVIVSLSGSSTITAGATTFTGVDQSSPTGTVVTAVGASTAPSVTVTSATGQMVFGTTAVDDSPTLSLPGGSGQTLAWNLTIATPANTLAGAASTEAGAASVTHSYTSSENQDWAIAAVPIKPRAATSGQLQTSFTQSPVFALPFNMASGATIQITNYVNVTSGTMPANPAITARLSAGGSTFLTLSSPTYNSGNGTLVWSGSLGSAVAITAGQAISLSISNAQSAVEFQIRYDSATYPSKIILPTASIIAVPSVGVYDAAYPGGTSVASSPITAQRYVRFTVTDPFGAYDITSAGLVIDGPGTSGDVNVSLTNANVVASNAWSKTYEYVWQTIALSGNYALTVTANEGSEGITATGNTTELLFAASLGDFVWNDANGNGQQDVGEQGLSNVVVRLFNTNNVVIGVATSTVNGAYAFTNLLAGNYTVSFTPPANYLSTTSNVGDDAKDSDMLAGTNRTAVVTLANNQSDITVDAGFYAAASIAGFVRIDLNGNGVAEAGDTNGIVGVTVQLLDAASNVVATASTAADGAYSFTGLHPGSYTVRETDLGGWYSTLDITAPNDNLIPVTLAIGQNSVNNNFHDAQRAAFGDRVWNDLDGDGIQEAFEPGIAGVRVYVDSDGSGTYNSGEPTATTASDGTYQISSLLAGSYTARVDVATLPAGMIQTYDLNGGLDHSASVTLLSNQTRDDVDFGYRSPAVYVIRGQVRDDYDLDGAFSDPDLPVGGVLVSLYSDPNGDGTNTDGVVIGTVWTSPDGRYAFTNVLSGAYVVVESDPDYSVSTADTVAANDNRIPVVIVNADSIENNFLDAVDPSGYLYDVTDGRIVPGGSVSVTGAGAQVLMDGSSGQYMFISSNSVETTFTIAVTPPPGYIIDTRRPAQPGSFDPTGGANPTVLGSYESTSSPGYLVNYSAASNTYYYTFTLAPGDPPVINNNFPLVRPVAIGDFVWEDLNGDGVQDAVEPGMTNITVNLLDASSNVVYTTVTDGAGAYSFTNLFPATYLVQVVPPAQYIFTLQNTSATNDLSDSDMDAKGLTAPIVLAAGVTDLSWDAGLTLPARIYGYAFLDLNTNLVRTAMVDYPIMGMTVTLWRAGMQVATTLTASDGTGRYEFTNLTAGAYTVRFGGDTNQLEAVPSAAPALTDPERNRAAVDGQSTISIAVTVVPGEGVTTSTEPRNAGFIRPERPLSESVAIRAYSASDGVHVEFTTASEAGYGLIIVSVWADGKWKVLGLLEAVGYGSNTYSFRAPGLEAGKNYYFQVEDEVGYLYDLYGVEVKPFAMEMQVMTRAGVRLSWNSIPGRTYEIYTTTRLGEDWTFLDTVAAESGYTSFDVKTDPAERQRFFKIVMVRNEVIE